MKLPVIAVLFLSTVLVLCAKTPRPLVIWHGLGDSHSSPGMVEFMSMIKDVHPGIFIHSVYIAKDLDDDRKAGFYGNVNEQVEFVADQLASIPELEGGFDGIGFSQGGQFLRAYVERYNDPPINNLVTFGSQHMGISDIPACRRYDFLCQVARRAAKGSVYTEWAQKNLVQAQYYRDPTNLEVYLSANLFLPSINNEVAIARNETYKHKLATLNNLVLVMFSDDETVVPKESSWFGAEAITDDTTASPTPSSPQRAFSASRRTNAEKMIVPIHLQPIYLENWIGLRDLDERGAIVFSVCKGEHMRLGDCWEDLVRKYAGELLE